jgi:hypothetical protein
MNTVCMQSCGNAIDHVDARSTAGATDFDVRVKEAS